MPEAPNPAPWQRHTPNALTLARLALAAGVFVVLSTLIGPATQDGLIADQSALLLAAGLFVVAAITDALDGHLARRWNVVSLFGRVVDPFADKILILGSFVCLAGPMFADPRGGMLSGMHPWMVVVVLARELLVTTLRGVYESRGVDFSATASGKFKMILQSVAVPIILAALALDPAEPGSPARWVVIVTAWTTLIVTAWSGVPYVLRAWRVSRAGVPES